MDYLDIDLAKASNLASFNPARFLSQDDKYGSLDVGKKASMVMLSDNNISHTWVNGELVNC